MASTYIRDIVSRGLCHMGIVVGVRCDRRVVPSLRWCQYRCQETWVARRNQSLSTSNRMSKSYWYKFIQVWFYIEQRCFYKCLQPPFTTFRSVHISPHFLGRYPLSMGRGIARSSTNFDHIQSKEQQGTHGIPKTSLVPKVGRRRCFFPFRKALSTYYPRKWFHICSTACSNWCVAQSWVDRTLGGPTPWKKESVPVYPLIGDLPIKIHPHWCHMILCVKNIYYIYILLYIYIYC